MTTKFVADDESSMYIDVYPITENTVDFDEEYSKKKDFFSSYTLINAENYLNQTEHSICTFRQKIKSKSLIFTNTIQRITDI